ncbi:hypothetical protein H0H93_012986 [Arthromyces matolae]|nr:hypothetical protein H0H93_012986 [Arthromyces matolae]
MPNTTIHDDYKRIYDVLPGIQDHYAQYASATALVHSGLFNDRGREFPSYGYGDLILSEFANLFPAKALLIPQFEVECYTIKHEKTIKLTDSVASLPQNMVRGPVPDHGIVLLRAMLESSGIPRELSPELDELKSWDEVKIYKMLIGVLSEAKGRPTRSAATAEDFMTDLRRKIALAMSALLQNAAVAFKGNEGTQVLILIAWAGEWFCWRVIERCEEATKHRQHILPGHEGTSASVGPLINAVQPICIEFPRHPDTQRKQPLRKVNTARQGSYNVDKLLKAPSSDAKPKKVPVAPPKAKEPGKTRNLRQVRKADFRRWDRNELNKFEDIEIRLTERQWTALQGGKSRSLQSFSMRVRKLLAAKHKSEQWSNFIQFGTEESKEAWFLMYKIMQEQITYLDGPQCPGREVVYEESDDESDNNALTPAEDEDEKHFEWARESDFEEGFDSDDSEWGGISMEL